MSEDEQSAVIPIADSKELLGAALVADMPAVDLRAVQAANAADSAEKSKISSSNGPTPAPAKTAASEAPPMDAQGRTFNPLIHEEEDGKPVFRKGTTLLKCRRTPLKELKTASIAPDPASVAPDPSTEPPAAVTGPNTEEQAAMRHASAAMLAGTMIGLGRIALGDEFAEESTDGQAIVASWEAILMHHQVEIVNPWMGLAIVTGAAVLKTVNKPKARPRLIAAWNWTKVKSYSIWLWLNGKMTPTKDTAAPRPNQPTPTT